MKLDPENESNHLVNSRNEENTASPTRVYGSQETIDYAENGKVNESVSETNQTRTKGQKFTIFVIFSIIIFFEWMAFFALVPFFTPEALKKGLSQGTVGWIIAVFPLTQVFASIAAGAYVTRIGAKILFCGGSTLNAVTVFVFGFVKYAPAGPAFAVLSIILRILMAIGLGLSMTTGTTLLITVFPENISTIVAVAEFVSSLGAMTGPLLGGILYQYGGFLLPFLVLGCIGILFAIISIIFMPSVDELRESKYSPLEFFKLFRNGEVIFAALIVFTHGFVLGVAEPTVSVHLRHFYHLNFTTIGLIYVAPMVLYGISSIPFGICMDKTAFRSPFMIFGVILIGASFFMVGESPLFGIIPGQQLWLTISGFCGTGIGSAFVLIPVGAYLAATILNAGYPKGVDSNGLLASIVFSSDNMGYFLGPIVGGYTTDAIGFPWACTIFGFFYLFMSLVMTLAISISYCCCNSSTETEEVQQVIETRSQSSQTGEENIIEADSTEREHNPFLQEYNPFLQ